jgi:hypothetical protein
MADGTVDCQQERVAVQQALLRRLRDQALRGELWAGKLLAEGDERDQKHSPLSSTPEREMLQGRDLSAGRGSPAGPYGA